VLWQLLKLKLAEVMSTNVRVCPALPILLLDTGPVRCIAKITMLARRLLICTLHCYTHQCSRPICLTKTETRPCTLGGLRHPAPLHEQQSNLPQVLAYLVFHRLMSLFHPQSIHSPVHQVMPSWASLHQYICINTLALSPLLFIQNTFTTSSFFSQSMFTLQPLWRHSMHYHLLLYQVIYASLSPTMAIFADYWQLGS
jgi:hypothetical protein